MGIKTIKVQPIASAGLDCASLTLYRKACELEQPDTRTPGERGSPERVRKEQRKSPLCVFASPSSSWACGLLPGEIGATTELAMKEGRFNSSAAAQECEAERNVN